ncbi:MAG TPA: hypothetical protein VJP86_05690 [Vicinamibacterales bacterium]|nr:hypothetical protein [Vicinamibacterales bacterium]
MRIAFDLDGVLADMDRELGRRADDLFRAGPPASDVDDRDAADEELPYSRLQLTARQQSRLWRQVHDVNNFWETLRETEAGIVGRIAKAADDYRWEVIFLTSRPACAGDTVQRQTQRWLESNGFRSPSVFVVRQSRGKIAAALELDVVVDDRLENCLDVVADSRARAMLVWRDEMERLPAAAKAGMVVAGTAGECVDLLIQLSDTPPGGLVEKFKRLLGMKAAALD